MPGFGLAFWWQGAWWPYATECDECEGGVDVAGGYDDSGSEANISNVINVNAAPEAVQDERPDEPTGEELMQLKTELRAKAARAKVQHTAKPASADALQGDYTMPVPVSAPKQTPIRRHNNRGAQQRMQQPVQSEDIFA